MRKFNVLHYCVSVFRAVPNVGINVFSLIKHGLTLYDYKKLNVSHCCVSGFGAVSNMGSMFSRK